MSSSSADQRSLTPLQRYVLELLERYGPVPPGWFNEWPHPLHDERVLTGADASRVLGVMKKRGYVKGWGNYEITDAGRAALERSVDD